MAGVRLRVAGILFVFVALVAFAARYWWSSKSPGNAAGADLVLITIDTLRADRVGVYGYAAARTPTLDGLAAAGTRFDQAVTPLPRTTPALASLFTGLLPLHHGSREVGQAMGSHPTLAAALRDAGYATVGVSANELAGRRERIDQGFDAFAARRFRADQLNAEVLARVDEVAADRPLFLWAHYLDPHMPYTPPGAFLTSSSAAESCSGRIAAVRRRGYTMGQVHADADGVATEVLPICGPSYDAEIAYTDQQVGQLLGELRQRRPDRPLLIVVTADHGENLGEAGLFYEHGPNLHEASLRVPLIASGPGVARRVDDELIRLEDLLPTLLRLLDVPLPDVELDGEDASARLQSARHRRRTEHIARVESGSPRQARYTRSLVSGPRTGFNCLNYGAYSLCGMPGVEPALYDHEQDRAYANDLRETEPDIYRALLQAREIWPAEEARLRGVRTERFKLVAYPDLLGGYRSELYDLQADPAEVFDVAPDHPRVAARLQEQLDDWIARFPEVSDPVDAPDSELLDALRSLGYVE